MGKFKPFVSSTGEIIEPDSIEQARIYKQLGWAHAGEADYERDRISKMYSETWADKALAFTQGVVQSVPFMQTFQNNVVNPYLVAGGPVPSMAQDIQAMTEANPGANWAGFATGMAGQILAPTKGILRAPAATAPVVGETIGGSIAQQAPRAVLEQADNVGAQIAERVGTVADNVAAPAADTTAQMAAPAVETITKTAPMDVAEFAANRTTLDFSAGKTLQQAVPKSDVTRLVQMGEAVGKEAATLAEEAANVITPEVQKMAAAKFSMGKALTAIEEKALKLMGPELAAKMAGMAGPFGQAAASGIQSGIMGMGYSLDQASMQHALTGEGQEKLFAQIGYDTMFSAAVGFAIPLAGPALAKLGTFKAMRKAGEKLQEWSNTQSAKSMMTAQSMRELDNIAQLHPALKYIQENKLSSMPIQKSSKWINERVRVVGQEMQRVKDGFEGMLSIPQQAELRSILKGKLADEFDYKAIQGYVDTKKGMDIEKLHQLRDKLDEMIDWNNPFKGKNATLNEARNIVNDFTNDLLKTNDPSGAFANQWVATNNEYHILKQLQTAVVDKQTQIAERGSLQKIAKDWSAVGAVHLMTGGMVNGAAIKVAMKTADVMKTAWQDGKIGQMGKILASGFLETENKFAKVINSKMIRTATGYQIGHNEHLLTDSSDLAKTTREQLAFHEAALNDPMESIGMLGTNLVNAGMPEELVMANLSRFQAATAFIYNERPKSPFAGTTIAPQEWTPDQSSMYKWLEQIDTLRYPELGIDDPSAHRLRVLEAVYPELLNRTRAIISDAVATNPDLSMEAQVWASKILKAPAHPLMHPTNYAIFAKARVANQPNEDPMGMSSTDPSSPDEDQMTDAQRIQATDGEL